MNVNAPQDPQTPVPQATAREFLAVVFRRKWLIIGLFAVTTLTVLAVALTTPVVYMSSSRVLIHRGEPQSLLTGYRTVFNDWEADLASEIEVARSYPVLQSARELLKADPKAAGVRLNARQVDVEVMGKSNVIALAYQDGDPEVAQQVCDALTRAYIDYRQNAMTLNYPQGFFRREIDKVRADLETWMEKRRRYAAENDIVDVDQQNRVLLDERSTLQKKLTDLQTDLAQNQTVYAVMEDMREHPSVDLPSLGPNMNGDALLEMKRRVLEQESRVALIRERYRDDSPEVMAANATLDTLRSLLRREVGSRMELSKSHRGRPAPAGREPAPAGFDAAQGHRHRPDGSRDRGAQGAVREPVQGQRPGARDGERHADRERRAAEPGRTRGVQEHARLRPTGPGAGVQPDRRHRPRVLHGRSRRHGAHERPRRGSDRAAGPGRAQRTPSRARRAHPVGGTSGV